MATPEEIAAQRRAALEAAARQPVYGPRNPQQPIASPGYSDDLNTRRVQAYRDAQQQRAAVAGEPLVSPGYTPGLASMQAAQDARMQREAVAALPPARVAGRDPDVPYAPAPAPIRPPVPAGRNPDVPYAPAPASVTPTAPAVQQPTQPGVAADFQRGLVGTAKAGVGALVYPAALALDASRRGVTSLVGGDVNTLPGGADYLTRQAEGAMAGGYEDAAGAAASLRGRTASQGRELLGVQQAADTPAAVTPAIAGTPSAAQTQAPDQASTAIRQDTANLRAYNEATNAQFAASDAQQAAYQQQLTPQPAATPASPYLQAERGNYTLQNTDRTALAERAAPTAGLTMGFAPGEATARMQGYAAQDAQRQAAFQAKRQRLDAAVEGIGLRNTIEQATNPQVRRAAQTRLAALETSGNLATQQAGETGRAGIAADADLARAGVAGQAAVAAAQQDAAARLQAAELTGQFGLKAAQAKAAGSALAELAKADTPQGQLAAQRAALIQQQLSLGQTARDEGDVSGVFAAYGLSRPAERVYTDPVTGAPLSAEQVRRLQAQSLQRLPAPPAPQ